MEITFLGTASSIPTKERNHSSLLVSYNGENLLVDCGEGTQRQLVLAGFSLAKIDSILISHWHGDHVLGIPGLVQTLGTVEGSRVLKIFGPKGTKKYINSMLKSFEIGNKVKIIVKEVSSGLVFESDNYVVRSALLQHSSVSLGYRIEAKQKNKVDVKKLVKIGLPKGPLMGKIQSGKDVVWKSKKLKSKDFMVARKNKVLTVIADTKYCKNAVDLSKGSDVLICESTFEANLAEKASKYLHMTSEDAAKVAKLSKSKMLYLTHFSSRYKAPTKLVKESKKIFKKTNAAKDLLKIKI